MKPRLPNTLATSPRLPALPKLGALSPEVAQELSRSFESSGTRARLRLAELTEAAGAPVVAPRDLKAAAGFELKRPDGRVTASVYFFLTYAELGRAQAKLSQETEPRSSKRAVSVVQNGAYLVRVVASGDFAQTEVGRIAQLIAGEE